ncbi:MAG: hypothetical protein NTX45_09425 [Proteobacteria bacterium]|nr:hypothetical protein [Pseudomonadota bacterium]
MKLTDGLDMAGLLPQSGTECIPTPERWNDQSMSASKQQQKVSRNDATKSRFTLRRCAVAPLRRCVRFSFGTMT